MGCGHKLDCRASLSTELRLERPNVLIMVRKNRLGLMNRLFLDADNFWTSDPDSVIF